MILKRKFRYVLAESTIWRDLMDRLAARPFYDSLLHIMGETAYANAEPRVVWQNGNFLIIKANRGSEKSIILALSFMKQLGSSRVGFYTIKTSGTIKALLSKHKA